MDIGMFAKETGVPPCNLATVSRLSHIVIVPQELCYAGNYPLTDPTSSELSPVLLGAWHDRVLYFISRSHGMQEARQSRPAALSQINIAACMPCCDFPVYRARPMCHHPCACTAHIPATVLCMPI